MYRFERKNVQHFVLSLKNWIKKLNKVEKFNYLEKKLKRFEKANAVDFQWNMHITMHNHENQHKNSINLMIISNIEKQMLVNLESKQRKASHFLAEIVKASHFLAEIVSKETLKKQKKF